VTDGQLESVGIGFSSRSRGWKLTVTRRKGTLDGWDNLHWLCGSEGDRTRRATLR
jgi:hypothetical protein